MARAFLGLGSNMGDRRAQLQAAIAQLPDLVAVSALYETQPLGGPPGQSPYLNMVVELDTDLSPRQLLELGQFLEGAAGRVRGTRWGPRPLDVDVLLVEDQSWTQTTSWCRIHECGSAGSCLLRCRTSLPSSSHQG